MFLIFQLFLSGVFSAFELDNPGRFIKQFPLFLRLPAEDLVNLSLPDNGIPFLADTRIIKQFIYVLQTANASVDGIFAFTGAVYPSGHRYLIIVNGELMVPIVQRYGHIGIAERLSGLCPGKNNVLHGSTPELLNPLLAQHPADRIGHIALSASVGPYNTGYAVVELKCYFIGKGFESLHFYAFQIHKCRYPLILFSERRA